ncbi:MAG: glycosyltransferase [Ghiorsea sp.]
MNNKTLNVLIIGLVWPEPNSTGASKRMMEYITLFSEQNHTISFTCPAAPGEHAADLKQFGVNTFNFEVNDSSFDDFVRDLQPNIVLFDRFLMEEQFGWRVEKYCPTAMRIIETIDLHCLREARHTAFKNKQIFNNNDLNNAIALREIASIYRSDLSIIISDVEHGLLQQHFNISPALLHLCPFMLDATHDPETVPKFEQRQHFMTIGNFRHAPNWDAVLWLKQGIWPLIRKQLPKAELHIYGAYTPPKATALHNQKEGFIIKDRADNVFKVMQTSRICLAPLRFGAGIKTKLADAMLAGTPSVTTDIGAEGMSGGLNWCGAIQNEPKAFADAAVALYQDQQTWKTAQKDGFKIINEHFNQKTHQKALLQRITEVLENLEQHRQNNFIGAMLNHHHHRSTEFMSRWIETKNKK